jgi:hypothetical protein
MGERRKDDEGTATTHGEGSPGSGWTTTKQAAKVLGVSRRSVQAYVRRGLLEAREEGEGIGKTFYVSIDSLNALRNRRSGEAVAPGVFAEDSPQNSETTNPTEVSGESLRHAIDRLEARTARPPDARGGLVLADAGGAWLRALDVLQYQLARDTPWSRRCPMDDQETTPWRSSVNNYAGGVASGCKGSRRRWLSGGRNLTKPDIAGRVLEVP